MSFHVGCLRQVDELRHEYGFDKPKIEQFGDYLKQIATFDYGRSYATKQPISRMIKDGIGPSLTLTLPAFFFTTLLAVSIGLLVALVPFVLSISHRE